MIFTQFGLYFFIFLLTESIVNEKAALICGPSYVNYIYAIGLIFTALGYLSFSFINKTSNKKVVIGVNLLIILSLIGLMTVESPALLLISSYLCLLTLGNLGGYIHYLASLQLKQKNFAIYLGISSMCGIIAQYIVQNINLSLDACISFLIFGMICLMVITILNNHNEGSKITTDFYISGISINSRTLVYILSVVIMSVILGFQDSIIVAKNASGELQLFSYVRLFYALGLLFAGMVANIKDRAYLPLASGCSMSLSVLAISFFGSSNSSYNVSMGIMYFYCGFYVMFMTIMFMELGIRKSNPAVYAGFGRVVRSITTCVIVLITTFLSNLDTNIYTILSCIFSIALIILMALSGILIPERTIIKEISVNPTEESLNKRLEDFFAKYALTQREQDAFVKLVTTEMGVQEIADEMAISRRVLQRHIASIYEKTGTKSRVGLLILFTN